MEIKDTMAVKTYLKYIFWRYYRAQISSGHMAVWCALDIVAPALDLPGRGSRLVEELQDVLHPHNEPAQVL